MQWFLEYFARTCITSYPILSISVFSYTIIMINISIKIFVSIGIVRGWDGWFRFGLVSLGRIEKVVYEWVDRWFVWFGWMNEWMEMEASISEHYVRLLYGANKQDPFSFPPHSFYYTIVSIVGVVVVAGV